MKKQKLQRVVISVMAILMAVLMLLPMIANIFVV